MTASRLDHDRLDEIVRDLDLDDADLLDRFRLSFQQALRDVWEWAKDITGGDGGWLDRVSDTLNQWLESFSGEAIPAEGILDTLYYGSMAILLALVGYGLYRLWRAYRPMAAMDTPELGFVSANPDLKKPLSQLPVEMWAPAMFNQVCQHLAGRQVLVIRPQSTNANIAAQAQLDAAQRVLLEQLALAADRALFGRWVPSSDELQTLTEQRDHLLATDTAG